MNKQKDLYEEMKINGSRIIASPIIVHRKVSREFVDGWAESIAGDTAINDIRRARGKVKSLIRQLGHEIEGEKEDGGE